MTWNLDAAVGQLTRETKHRVVDPVTGEARWVTAQPLLVQLVVAIANSGASTTFKGSGGNPIPISAQALDVYQEIEAETARHWWALHHLHHGQGRSTLAGRLRAWAMAVRVDAELLAEAEGIIVGWVTTIAALLQPVRRREILGACPECEVAKVVRQDDDGETVKAPALVLMYDGDGRPLAATCQSCGVVWERHEIVDLAERIGTWQHK